MQMRGLPWLPSPCLDLFSGCGCDGGERGGAGGWEDGVRCFDGLCGSGNEMLRCGGIAWLAGEIAVGGLGAVE
jgi:hypothetical protein